MNTGKPYRGRIAPTPTGLLHLGHARTFLTAADRASAGELVLRIEDLDEVRCRPEFGDAAMEDLRWLGIRWQEGPDTGGPHAPYVQSRRRRWYEAAWRKLVKQGHLYPCRCSRKDLRTAAMAPHAEDEEPLYPGTCRGRQWDGATGPGGAAWRFRVPEGETITFEDGRSGLQTAVAGRDFGDFVIWRRDDVPAYQLAVVVDDAAMGITEVVRGEDLLVSTFRQLLIYRALELEPPDWYHCPLVRDEQGRRLAKRHAAASVRAFREAGRCSKELRELQDFSNSAA